MKLNITIIRCDYFCIPDMEISQSTRKAPLGQAGETFIYYTVQSVGSS
jgi:hypothetical protein